MKQSTPASSQDEIYNSALRHLPSYEEATATYTLRLPNYRSSYIRRFHPYPRYTTPPPERYSADDRDEDMLDLSILDYRVRQLAVERRVPVDEPGAGNDGSEQAGEDGEDDVDADPVVAYNNSGEELFIKLDTTDTLNILPIG